MQEVLNILKELPRFTHKRVEQLLVSSTHFSEHALTVWALAEKNLSAALNSPLGIPEVEPLDMVIRKRFKFKDSQNPQENVRLFHEWLRERLTMDDPKAFAARLKARAHQRFGAGLAEHLTRYRPNPSLNTLKQSIHQRCQELQKTPKLSKQDLCEIGHARYVIADIYGGGGSKSAVCPYSKERYNYWRTGFDHKEKWLRLTQEHRHKAISWNYKWLKEAVGTLNGAIDDLDSKYRGWDMVFLARDGIILYEDMLLRHPVRGSNSLFYLSRDTLRARNYDEDCLSRLPRQDFFHILRHELLDPVLKEYGYDDAAVVVLKVKERMLAYFQREGARSTLRKSLEWLFHDVFVEINHRAEGARCVFVDSSSKTFPILLAAFASIMFPQKRFAAYFAITPFTDPKAGFLRGHSDTFTLDFIADEVMFHSNGSNRVPYSPGVKNSDAEHLAGAFIAQLMLRN